MATFTGSGINVAHSCFYCEGCGENVPRPGAAIGAAIQRQAIRQCAARSDVDLDWSITSA